MTCGWDLKFKVEGKGTQETFVLFSKIGNHYVIAILSQNERGSRKVTKCKTKLKQECIPVGCVPAARRPYAGVCFQGGVLPVGGFSMPGGFSLRGGSPCQGGSPCRGGSPCQGGGSHWSGGVLHAGGFSMPGGVLPAGVVSGEPPCEQNE